MYTGILAALSLILFIASIVLVGAFGQLWAAPIFAKSLLVLFIACPVIAGLEEMTWKN